MNELYDGALQSGLRYITQSVEQYDRGLEMLAVYDSYQFSQFKNNINTSNNKLGEYSFYGVDITSGYSKLVVSEYPTTAYKHANYKYRAADGPRNMQEDLDNVVSYLQQTGQEIPDSLRVLLESKTSENINMNTHANTVLSGERTAIGAMNADFDVEEGAELFGYYSSSYGNHGQYSNWKRHGQYDKYSQFYTQYSEYSRSYGDSPYGDYSRYSKSYVDYYYDSDYYDSDHYDYLDKHKDVMEPYTTTHRQNTYPTKKVKNFAPIKPQIYAPEQLNVVSNNVTIGYHSYDRNVQVNSALSQVRYKVEIQKTSGPNTRGWTTIQDSLSDTVTINPLDPFNIGWSQTSQGYGGYQLRITPYNTATTFSDGGWSYSAPQLNGEALIVNFTVKVNRAPALSAQNKNPVVGATFHMDGAVKGNTSYNYNNFYGNGVPSSNRRGIYLAVAVNEADAGQYLKGEVLLKNRGTNGTVITKPITWSNGSATMASSGGTVTGYVFVSSDELKNLKFNGQLEMVIGDYYDSACTSLASTSTTRQNFVSGSDTTLLNIGVDMQKTLNFDVVKSKISSDITVPSTVTVAVNTQEHLQGSFKNLEYSWSTSATSPGTYRITPNRQSVITMPKNDGKWYLHLKANDKYGNSITHVEGPLFYSSVGVVQQQPKITHFDDSDKLKISANITTKPSAPVTYEYRYAYKPTGSSGGYAYSQWSGTNAFTTPNLKIHAGVDIITEVRIKEIGQVFTSPAITVTLNDKLSWCIKHQGDANYNLESQSLPDNKFHNSSGMTADGFKVMKNLSTELQGSLRPNEYYYYKLQSDNTYKFKKILYFKDPIN